MQVLLPDGGSATVTSSGTVDTSTPGTYTITYTATDASGNTSTAQEPLQLQQMLLLQ